LLVAPAITAPGESQTGPQSLGRSIFSAITGALGADSGSETRPAENGQARGEVSNG
jgi:hypothetical protein